MGQTITTTTANEAESRAEIYQRITDRIGAAIEAGAGDWRMPWQYRHLQAIPGREHGRALGSGAGVGLPERDMGHVPAVCRIGGADTQG